MARPRAGRLPKDASNIVAPTRTVFIPASAFNGVSDDGTWMPRSTAEAISFYWYEPRLDVGSAINVRVHWATSSSTTTDTATWRVLYDGLTLDTTAVANGATALNTTIVADNAIATANALLRTAAGVINGASLTDGQAVVFTLNCNAVSGLTLNEAHASRVTFLGLEIEYTLTNL